MRCDQAQQLFDAYLDGELSSSMATELGAHRIRCSECRQALALLEVSGHIVRTDQEPVQLKGNFTDRLLGCMDQRSAPWLVRHRREIYIAGPLAAAAVIAMAFLGAFDNQKPQIAGERATGIDRPVSANGPVQFESTSLDGTDDAEAAQQQLEAWINQTRSNIANKRDSGASLQQLLDQTATQWGRILDDSEKPAATSKVPTASQSAKPPSEDGEPDPGFEDDTDG